MELNNFTQKSLEAIQAAQNLAMEYGNPQVEEIHLNYSLVNQEDGLIPRLISYMGENLELIRKDIEREVERLPKQTGGTIYPSRIFNKILNASKDEAKKFGDEYIGTEHLYIRLLKEKDTKSEAIFKRYNISLQRFLDALREVRGNQTITSDNPEATYDALRRYGSTTSIICFVSGVQLISLGVIGEYIGKMYMETKRRPRYIVYEKTKDKK